MAIAPGNWLSVISQIASANGAISGASAAVPRPTVLEYSSDFLVTIDPLASTNGIAGKYQIALNTSLYPVVSGDSPIVVTAGVVSIILATGALDGAMSAADFAKLDAASATRGASTLVKRNADGQIANVDAAGLYDPADFSPLLTIANGALLIDSTAASTSITNQSLPQVAWQRVTCWNGAASVAAAWGWVPMQQGASGSANFALLAIIAGAPTNPIVVTPAGAMTLAGALYAGGVIRPGEATPTQNGEIGRDTDGKLTTRAYNLNRKIALAGVIGAEKANQSGDYTLLIGEVVPFTTNGGAIAATLPATSTAIETMICGVVITAGTNNVTVTRAGSDVIVSPTAVNVSPTAATSYVVTPADGLVLFVKVGTGGTWARIGGATGAAAVFDLDVTLTGGTATQASGRTLTGAKIISVRLKTATTAVGAPVATISGNNVIVTSYAAGAIQAVTDASTYTVSIIGAT